MHYVLGMKVWTREVCSKDPEEVQDDYCKAMTTPMASNLKLLIFASSELVDSTMYRQMIFSSMYLTNTRLDILLCCEHLNLVPDRSETCSLDCCKAYSEVPEGYN